MNQYEEFYIENLKKTQHAWEKEKEPKILRNYAFSGVEIDHLFNENSQKKIYINGQM